jgi:hypothetical protein
LPKQRAYIPAEVSETTTKPSRHRIHYAEVTTS